MRFGVYTEMQCPSEKPHEQLYWEIERQIEHADEVGFDVYSTIGIGWADRHRRYSHRGTARMRGWSGPCVVVSRVGDSHYRIKGPLRRGVRDSACAWTEERFSYQGQFWQIHNARVVPRPLQKPYPLILTGETNEATSELASARGYGLFLAPPFPFVALERQIRVYQEACAKHGHILYLIYLRPISLGDDPAQIRRECKPYLFNFLTYTVKCLDLICHSREALFLQRTRNDSGVVNLPELPLV